MVSYCVAYKVPPVRGAFLDLYRFRDLCSLFSFFLQDLLDLWIFRLFSIFIDHVALAKQGAAHSIFLQLEDKDTENQNTWIRYLFSLKEIQNDS